jgi:hypothetical protein
MKVTIQPKRHFPLIRPFGLFFKKRSFSKEVFFSSSLRWTPEGIKAYEGSRLFGVAYLSGPLKDSASFSFRYCPVKDAVCVYADCLVDGERIVRHICDLRLERPYRLKLFISAQSYWFEVRDLYSVKQTSRPVRISFSHDKKWKALLGVRLCFPAPHPISLYLKSLPK